MRGLELRKREKIAKTEFSETDIKLRAVAEKTRGQTGKEKAGRAKAVSKLRCVCYRIALTS